MTTKEIAQGQMIYERGEKIEALYLIVRGTVSAAYPGGRFLLRRGDVIGVCEINTGVSFADYKAQEAVSSVAYPVKDAIRHLFENSIEAVHYFWSSAVRQLNTVMTQYQSMRAESTALYNWTSGCCQNYTELCSAYEVVPEQPEGYKELAPLVFEEDVPAWLGGYYTTLEQMLAVWDSNKTDIDFITGFLVRVSQDTSRGLRLCTRVREYSGRIRQILMNEKEQDLLTLLMSLYAKAAEAGGLQDDRTLLLRRNIDELFLQLKNCGLEKTSLYQTRRHQAGEHLQETEKRCQMFLLTPQEQQYIKEELAGSLDQIFDYAECGQDLKDSFRQNIESYKSIPNKSGTEEDIRLLRQRITKEFYLIYTAAFKSSLQKGQIPKVVKMFFHFGYVDEELAGLQNAAFMYRMTDKLFTSPGEGIYSFYEWLMAIYRGEKEPSRNEFDLDYTAYLHEQVKLGKITKEREKVLLTDNLARVTYELEHVFPLVNKVTYGRISTFCPVFSAHNVQKGLDGTLVRAEKIAELLESIRKKDFGAYCRETLYTNPEQGIPKEYINVEVLPDIILMPNVGSRGVMWQEIEGKRRSTPARWMCSVFQTEDLTILMLRLTAEFRWEMCKRVQGGRWNDVSERSLTSEYFDYIQFYRKNQELSADAKEKIKTDMGRAKNSFKEMFVLDYLAWMLFESSGSPRLNKVARGIFFTYCAFPREIREKLKANPMYKELCDRYDVRMGQKRHRMDILYQKLTAQGKEIPTEIEKEKEFLYR